MSSSLLDSGDLCTFQYIITHVFCPLQLPGANDRHVRHECSLAGAVASAWRLYHDHVGQPAMLHWHSIARMLGDLQTITRSENLDRSQTAAQLRSMGVGDVLAFLIQAQNAAVIFRKQQDVTIFEAFEVSPKAENVMATRGKLMCSYPGPSIEVPNAVFKEGLLSELASFLTHMNDDILDAAPLSRKAQTTVIETRDTAHPRYITELLTGIFRGVGRPADTIRITKRIGDDVSWNDSKLPWRRSPLWLLIKVAIQTSLDRSTIGRATYKEFILFFMCGLADEKTCTDLSNDTLQFMSAKISRRLRKLGSSAPNWLSRIVLQRCTSLRSILEKRWGQVRATQSASPLWAPSQLSLTRDTELSLLSSGDHLRRCLTGDIVSPLGTSFKPQYCHRGSLGDFLSSDGAFFEEVYRSEPHIALYDVECAVESEIDGWVEQVKDGDEACVKLEILSHKYSSSALKTYGNNPELLSVMLLTTIELWAALDKITIREIPMLADYSPEIPIRLLEDLLLCKATSLRRLRRLYHYLTLRHSRSRRHPQSESQWSTFSPTITTNTFALRYYEGSPHLQHLKNQIEEKAQQDVDEKVAQLEKANADYTNLQQQIIDTEHSSVVTQDGREFHPKKCRKCGLERQLRRMKIVVHEWPLPAADLQAKMVTFELDCPVSFNMWRTATLHLLVDLCSSESPSQPKEPYIKLSQYSALQPYFIQHPRSRISLGSDTKPFVVTHYSKVSIPATRGQVCVNNGLKLYGFDTHARVPTSKALIHLDIKRHCTYKLHPGPYHNLQKYVGATSHTSNEVMANQVDCDNDLSIHEYVAFGHLRSGGLLQWLNILRSLRDRSLNFRCQEVHFLIAQAVSHVGPLVDEVWTWHQEVQRPSFCYALMTELESLLRDVKTNWLEGVTMDTISFLLRRLLTSSPVPAVSQKVVGLLRVMRQKVFSWVTELSAKLATTPGDEELRGLLLDTAAVCRSTFDVDSVMIQTVLCSAEDVKILLFSAIVIHDNTPGKDSSLPTHSQLLLDRDRRLSLTLEGALSGIIRTHIGNQGIDLAVREIWPLYRPGSQWKPSQHSRSPWFSCTTAPTRSQSSQVVAFDLLHGSLLVNGRPLGRLPSEILRNPLYGLIFGKQVLDVIPADLPGMDYATRDTISGHQVYFSMRSDSLVIRAKRAATRHPETLVLVPQEKLEGDLPRILIKGYAHWLNVSTSVLEIRPLGKLWESSPDNWSINCSPGLYRAKKGCEQLVDIRSPTWAMVSSLLKPLDSPQNLIITISPVGSDQPLVSSRIAVDLPRYGLSFYVDEDDDLQSRNIRGMVYDRLDQATGAMFGLLNQLVLRPKSADVNSDAPTRSRCVLIPEGDVSFQINNHHVCVEIDTQGPTLQRITYQTYRVDTDLGCLAGNVSLTNKLYCAYLHALTSGCGTDPLTGRSGIEEALSILRSAGCWSIMKLSPREADLLGQIASLCPRRSWYPEHLRCMQKVEWLNLPVGSQHHELYVVAKGIKEHCERVLLFQETQSNALFESFPLRDEHLLERSTLRAAYLFPSELSGQPSPGNFDVDYKARDLVASSSGEHRACTAAAIVFNRSTHGATGVCAKIVEEAWKQQTVSGKAPLSLQYDRSWLNPDLPSVWLEAYNLLRRSDKANWVKLLFSLPALAYATSKYSDLVPAFVAFAADPRFCLEDPPPYDNYDISEGYHPSEPILRGYITGCTRSFEISPEGDEPARPGESSKALRKRQLKMYTERRDSDANTTVRHLLDAWPCEIPPRCSLNPNLYDVTNFTSKAQRHFSSCYRNLKLREHVTRVQAILNKIRFLAIPTPKPQYAFQRSQSLHPRVSWQPSFGKLFTRPAPSLPPRQSSSQYTPPAENTTPLSGSAPLHQLITIAQTNATNKFQVEYVSGLRESANSLGEEILSVANGAAKRPTTEQLRAHYVECRVAYIRNLQRLKRHLGPTDRSEQALEQSGQWPCVTAHALLRTLTSNSPITLAENWKKCLTQLALLFLKLQRAQRLLRLHLDNFDEEFYKESENDGGWVEEHPDWLLIQLQGNFMIRRVQVDVASEMISPRSGRNTAMQLNMGEGKSSVIVPVSAAALADGDQLVRVIVPKALTAQMFQLLVDRLSGLANRRIYFIPFSRSLNVSSQQVDTLRQMMLECMRNRGILVVQPEHVLSLKLVSVERQLSPAKGDDMPTRLLDLQKWLHSHSRDILDESDEVLHVRYQLVYTIGLQRNMEGSPDRWTTTQQVLGLVNQCASLVRKQSPLGIEHEHGPPRSFPHLRILQADTGQGLISCVVQAVMDGRLPTLDFRQLSQGVKKAFRNFISRQDVAPAEARLVEDYTRDTPLWSSLLLLRGLLGTGILLFALTERRWRVDYGLSLSRTMLAVPYRAKDVPAQRAEFGHPDVAIILTCLSYYYGGLNEEQLRVSFKILLKQDDPSLDYDLWVRGGPSVPEGLRSLHGINVKSSEQWQRDLIPLFSRNKATIDFYLSRVVFPKEAKEFPSKLSCSGWDLAEERKRLLTGFSGTNDGRYLLPLHITQDDPKHQRGTNAKVLSYLLQPENDRFMSMTHKDGKRRGERRTTPEFLDILIAQRPQIRVLLDVGAQMLDLENHELAGAWLNATQESSAAIYFNEDDELTVLTRDGSTQLLLSSPFAQQLDRCVVYLDDAHTRGTDINFPKGFRAAVTLGPKVTKDRLVQGCMRMRKLGHGHSVMFFAPLEVEQRIRYVVGKSPSSDINAMDILRWVIRETCDDIQRRAPHWAQQGIDHESRHAAWSDFCKDQLSSKTLSNKWLQPEAKKMEDLYGPRNSSSAALANPDIRRHCNRLRVPSFQAVSMDEEQEREVIHEAEREQQAERPPRISPVVHSIHPDVVAFARTGFIPPNTKAFRPAFKTLDATSAVFKEAHVWNSSILATIDFEKTVGSPSKADDYVRPVMWIVSGKRARDDVLVILSPYEANYLIPDIRSNDKVHLHVYTPRVTKSMKPCDDLALYNIPSVPAGWIPPSSLMDQLNMFAGQLYLKDYGTYIRLCRFLCVYAKDLEHEGSEEEIRIGSCGFIAPRNRTWELQAPHTFQSSPLGSLKILMDLRRKRMRFASTHIGQLLDGRVLPEDDFDECDDAGSAPPLLAIADS